jgi:hypothetical protein
MQFKPRNVIGTLLILFGALIAIFSEKIVFPGLERLIGIENIVGKENVIYEPGGGYFFTNLGAMSRWILFVCGIGISIGIIGVLILIRSSKK